METVEVIVPVRPGTTDRFPVEGGGGQVSTRVIECADANLSALWRDAWTASRADVVIFKHDDFRICDWEAYSAQLFTMLRRHLVVGVAGAQAYAPHRPAWWHQYPERGPAVLNDGNNRGVVRMPTAPKMRERAPDLGPYFATCFGPPGPVAVCDGCCVAVRRTWEAGTFGGLAPEQVAGWWDPEFGLHFYDIAFTYNASRWFRQAALGPACYVIVAEVIHESGGDMGDAFQMAARRFAVKYGSGGMVRA